MTKGWSCSRELSSELERRENNICGLCDASARNRAQASMVLGLVGVSSTKELVHALKQGRIRIYETAAYNVFRLSVLRSLDNYVVSEYVEPGESVILPENVRREDLQSLSFASESFDIVLTSDVLEHVADLRFAMNEISRVLKKDGMHVFTVPVDAGLTSSRDRAVLKNGELTHILPAIRHGDTIRKGAFVFRDFGADIESYLVGYGVAVEVQHIPVVGAGQVDVFLMHGGCDGHKKDGI